MLEYDELVARLIDIEEIGYVKTHRSGDTGIGKTLEDLLGITENNVQGPDTRDAELKSARKNSTSMTTLLTHAPLPRRTGNSNLLARFGYTPTGRTGTVLHTTLSGTRFNTLRGRIGFRVNVTDQQVNIMSEAGETLAYWDRNTLRESFERKLPRLIYVLAENRGSRANEEFWFNEAWALSGFGFDNFIDLIRHDAVKTDIRIGRNSDGSTHDHGTGFRVFKKNFGLCFENRTRII